MDQTIGSRISQARLAEGQSQDDLARKIGFSQAMISHWETGRLEPNPAQMKALEAVLGPLAKTSDDLAETPMPTNSPFGAWLRSQRSQAKMSVAELAKASALSQMAIYNIESGKIQNPQAETRIRLERALNKQTPEDVQKETRAEQNIQGVVTLVDFDPHTGAVVEALQHYEILPVLWSGRDEVRSNLVA
jgi:transcriptional regulator with XRE-family HTH domain